MQIKTDDLNPEFINAVNDFYSLLNKKYPQKAILKLIGDRYKLSGEERTMLYRGIFLETDCEQRLPKISKELNGEVLSIDVYNVLYTIGAYLSGRPLFVANDGMLRDASEIHGKRFRKDTLKRSVDLLLAFLGNKNVGKINFYIDAPISNSGKLKILIEQKAKKDNFAVDVFVCKSVDYQLIKIGDGFVSSSDSVVIDKAKVKIYDLAFWVLQHHFNPKIVILNNILNK